MSQLCF